MLSKMHNRLKGPGGANRGGADAKGVVPGRGKTLASISTAEGYQNAIPTQGQAGQFKAVNPARVAALKKIGGQK